MHICKHCQYINPAGAVFCNRCGNHMGETKDPLADRIIDKYKIVEKIGGGGFGAVYRAEHFELQTPFAIKILHAHLVDNETMVQRFRREAVLLGGLSHPNIVRIYGPLVTGAIAEKPDDCGMRKIDQRLRSRRVTLCGPACGQRG